jgi:hypothetical protein
MSYRSRSTNVATNVAANLGLGLVLLAVGFGCSTSSSQSGDPMPGSGGSVSGGKSGGTTGSGGSPGTGGSTGGSSGGSTGSGGSVPVEQTGGSPGASGGQTASGGQSGSGGTGGASTPDTGGTSGSDAAGPADVVSPPAGMGGPLDFGGVHELPLVPLQHTPTPVPPIIAAECPDDPTKGFTEYEDSFVVQRPNDLPASDRVKYENGIYTFTIKSGDASHMVGGTNAPRTEARYSDMSTGIHIWTGDVMFESPSKTCVFQIHNVNSPIAIYLRVEGNEMFNLVTRKTILTNYTGKWFNLKVVFNAQTREVKTFVNNCPKETSQAPSTASVGKWYFKHGVYTCESGTCVSHYKNIHLYEMGSTDKYNVKSEYK